MNSRISATRFLFGIVLVLWEIWTIMETPRFWQKILHLKVCSLLNGRKLRKKSKEKGKPTTLFPSLSPTLSPSKSTQEVHQTKTPPINTSPSTIVRESSNQNPTNRKRKLFVVGDSHLKRLSKHLLNYSIRNTYVVIKNFDVPTTFCPYWKRINQLLC